MLLFSLQQSLRKSNAGLRFNPPVLRILGCALIFGMAVLMSGCELFTMSSQLLKSSEANNGLPPLRPTPDAIGIRYTFVERPVGDPLLGKEIWKDVSEILVGMDPELSTNLSKNGFRIGWISSFPDSMQELLNLPGEQPSASISSTQSQFAGRNLFVRHGHSFEIQTGDVFPHCDLTLFRDQTEQSRESIPMESAHGLFKVKAYKEQEGWASLEFTPEFQHGGERVRPIAGESDWEPNYSQISETLYSQKFKLEMNVGDTAIITAKENCPGTAGYYFFRGAGADSNIQRVLLIRLVHVPSQADMAPAESGSFSSSLMKLTSGTKSFQ